MRKYLLNRNFIVFVLLCIISLFAIYMTFHNYDSYQDTIIKITKISSEKVEERSNTLGIIEPYYFDHITGKIKNGDKKDEIITIDYERSFSSVVTEKYEVGDEVFVKDNHITGLKRDKYIVILVIIFVMGLFLVSKVQGLTALFTVVVNALFFYFSLDFYFKGINLVLLCLIESIIFTLFSLIFSNGLHKKTLVAIASVLVTVFVLLGIVLFVVFISHYEGIQFNDLSFLTVPPEEVFLAEILIGGLGAVMDVSMTISSAFTELLEKNPLISKKTLIKSGREIGKDVMGTMCNVLFFTYLCSGLPLFVLALRNGFSLTNYVTSNFSIEFTRFLVGAIGIVLTIPVSIFVFLLINRKVISNE